MRFFPGKFHLYKGASTFVILQAQFLLLRRNAERIFATETRRHGERVSPTVLCGHGKKGHCSKLAEKNLVKLSLRAQRSNLVNGKGLLRRCAPRNDRLKGSLSAKLLQSRRYDKFIIGKTYLLNNSGSIQWFLVEEISLFGRSDSIACHSERM